MKNQTDIIDELLEKPCYIIDFLPERVLSCANGQFFDVEYYLLNSDKHIQLKDKFASVILKLMCYYHVSVLWNGWIDRPSPKLIDEAISEIMSNHSGSLVVLFPDENALLVFDWDSLNLSIYNPTETVALLIDKISYSEGLFWRKSCT